MRHWTLTTLLAGSLAALALAAAGGCGKGIESAPSEDKAAKASGGSATSVGAGKADESKAASPASGTASKRRSLGGWTTLTTFLPRSYKVHPTATALSGGQVLVWGHEPAAKGLVLDVKKDVVAHEVDGRFPRREHAAVRLPNGKVLLSGGANVPKNFYIIKSAVIFDPATATVEKTDSMKTQRRGHSAHLGADDKAYVIAGMAGGLVPPSKNIDQYDPETGKWKVVGRLQRARFSHRTAELEVGKVLVVGGHDRDKAISTLELCVLGDKVTCTSLPLGSPRDKVAVARLGGETALIVGGYKMRASDEALLFDAKAFKTERVTKPRTSRNGHTATAIGDGRVLVVGGSKDLKSEAEIFDAEAGTFRECGRQSSIRFDGAAVRLADGRVVVLGGVDASGAAVNSIDIWTP